MPSRDEIDLSASTVTVDLDPDRNESEQSIDEVVLTARLDDDGEIVFDDVEGPVDQWRVGQWRVGEGRGHAVARHLGRHGGKVVEVSGPPERETT